VADTLRLRPADLLVDPENPRLAKPNQGQHDTLKALWASDPDKLLALAADITEQGRLDPTNRLLVMPFNDNGRPCHLVLEGNRRLAAIKGLESPDMLQGAIPEGKLKELRQYGQVYQQQPIDEIDCVKVDKREDAYHWLELRHTGENDGAGIYKWGSQERENFLVRSGKASRHKPHMQLLNFLERSKVLTAERRADVPATTLERMIDHPGIREKLGLETVGGELRLRGAEDKVAKAAMAVVDLLIDQKIKVKDVMHKKDRDAFAESLPAVKAVRPAGKGIAADKAVVGTAKQARTKKVAAPRDRLIPPDCVMKTTGRIALIENELRKLSLDQYSNAVAVLLRVFVELTVDDYIERNQLATKDDGNLRYKMEQVNKDLVGKKKLSQQQSRAVSAAISGNLVLAPSVTTMNGYVHNKHLHAGPADLRAAWDNLQSFATACWSP
jgi:hypothetical protein